MTSEMALFARTFLIGIAVAAPVGAMGVLCIQRTLVRGWRSGMATGLGIATADGIYAAAAAFGLTVFSAVLVSWQTPLRVAGGLVLVAIGLRAAFTPATTCDAETSDEVSTISGDSASSSGTGPTASVAGLYASAVGLTLTNPMTIMAFGAIFAGAGLAAQPGLATAALATIGVACGSLAWWAILVSGVALARHAIDNRLLTGINIASGAIVALFGVLAIASVFVG